MKRKILLIVTVLFMTLSNIKAQDVFNKGTIVVDASIGLSSYNTYSVYGRYGLGLPPIGLTVDVGVVDGLISDRASIGIGGYAGFTTYSRKYYDYYQENLTRMCFGARGSFHFQLSEKLDTYAGLMLALYTYSYKYSYNPDYYGYTYENLNTNHSNISISPFIGTRYYISNNFGFNAEVGYGFTYISAGLTLKFK